jgi:hypothetical protein
MEGIEKTAIVNGAMRRSKRKVVRFADETKHLPQSFGGSAGTNNGFTVGGTAGGGYGTPHRGFDDTERSRQNFTHSCSQKTQF